MSNYMPFMKLKGSELGALVDLSADSRNLIPFFDFPKKKITKTRTGVQETRTKEQIFKSDVTRIHSKIDKRITWLRSFYLDNFDVEDSLKIDGDYNYKYLISNFCGLGMIPVLGLDRSDLHCKTVLDALDSGCLSNDRIAIRILKDDFLSYRVVAEELSDLYDFVCHRFEKVDLIFDCRFCFNEVVSELSACISNFIKDVSNVYQFERFVVSGSSIPSSISEIITTNETKDFSRNEIEIFDLVNKEVSSVLDVWQGDYTCVSPDYSDVDLFAEDMANVTTAKIMYPYDKRLLIIRGGRIKGNKDQYNVFSKNIVDSLFYRGEEYSFGDGYLHEKSKYEGSGVNASSVVKPLINLHLTYMLKR